MKLLLFKILLQRRAQDEGFVLPVVIAIGLIMILLSALNVVQSSEENITAITQNSRSGALAAAEIGIARYRELLDQNRTLAIYSLDSWTSVAEVCDAITDTGSGWASTADTNDSDWRDITVNGDSLGSYKIVNYIYDIDNDLTDADDNDMFAPNDDKLNDTDPFDFNDTGDTYNPRGILTVKGRDTNGAEAQIEVEIPIRINTQDMDNLAPVLWIGNGSLTNAALGTVNLTNTSDRIVYSIPNTGCPDPAGDQIISDPRDIPSITNIATEVNSTSAGEMNNLSDINADALFGNLTDNTHQYLNETRYYYKSNSGVDIENAGNTTVQTDGTAKVTWYVEGNDIKLKNTNPGGTLNVLGTTSSAYLEIYLAGNEEIEITPNDGIINIRAFIHAPDSTVRIKGTGTVNIRGAVWVKDWDNDEGAVVNIASDTTGGSGGTEKSYKLYTTTVNRSPKVIMNPPVNWKTEEVN